MALSTSTLIHFTNSKENLKSILEDNFRINICFEQLTLPSVISNPKIMGAFPIYVPMVCFCDIPLSEIKDHMSKYGNYGLGMTKEWGIRNRLNPVLYLEKNSFLYKSLYLSRGHFKDPKIEGSSDAKKALSDFWRYVKNYEGPQFRNGKLTSKNYRFYDEREWRYVPPYTSDFPMFLNGIHLDPVAKAALNEKLDNLRLEFEPNDIKYVIINDDSEINDFVGHLYDAKGKKYSAHDIERLTTRILTSEQIKSDM